MKGFTKAFLSELSSGRAEAILNILNKARSDGKIRTREEFEAEFLRLIEGANIEEWKRVFNPILPSLSDPVIRSTDLNDNFAGIYEDVFALFNHVSKLGATVSAHSTLMAEDLIKAKDSIKKLLEDAALFKYKRLNPEWNEIKYNGFALNQNNSTGGARAEIDTKVTKLTLGKRSIANATARYGNEGTTISVNLLSDGSGSNISTSYKPENALDDLRNTFWGYSVLSDDKLKTVYNNVRYDGVVVEVTLKFQGLRRFNTVEILPFAFYPVRVIDIATSDNGSTFTTWSGFTAGNPTLDWMVFNAYQVSARYLKIVFHQENFEKLNYLFPEQLVNRTSVWEHIFDKTMSTYAEQTNLLPQDERARLANKELNAFIDAQKALDGELTLRDATNSDYVNEASYYQRARNITNMMFGTRNDADNSYTEMLPGRDGEATEKKDMVNVVKYEYILGASIIRAADVTYDPFSEYKSPKYLTKGQIINVRLDTDESHYYDALNRQLTSVDYSVEFDTNRSYPIMPYGTTTIYNEYMALDKLTMTGKTRFYPSFSNYDSTTNTATSNANEVVYMNGRVLDATEYSFTWDGVLTINNYILLGLTSEYVLVSYDVGTYSDAGPESDVVLKATRLAGDLAIEELIDTTALAEPLIFEGTDDKGKIQLPCCPYVAREVVNSSQFNDPVWDRPDKRKGLWFPRHSAGPQNVDGAWYGEATAYIAYSYDWPQDKHYIILSNSDSTPVEDNYTVEEAGIDPTSVGFADYDDLYAIIDNKYICGFEFIDTVDSTTALVGNDAGQIVQVTLMNVLPGYNTDDINRLYVTITGAIAPAPEWMQIDLYLDIARTIRIATGYLGGTNSGLIAMHAISNPCGIWGFIYLNYVMDNNFGFIDFTNATVTGYGGLEVTSYGLEGTPDLTPAVIAPKISALTLYTEALGKSKIELYSLPYYEPIVVKVGGKKANNVTNYMDRIQPAFAKANNQSLDYEYVQVGRNLYFNEPVNNAKIEVDYRYKTKYIQLIATLRSMQGGRSIATPIIDNYKIAMQTARY